MNIFLQSLGSRVAKSLTKPYSVPVGEEDTWSDLTSKEFDANSKAQNALLFALNEDDLTRLSIANLHMRFGNTYCSLMREHHKSRELKYISCVPNMKVLKCKKMNLLMI